MLKYAVVRTPRSVYAAIPGRNKFRPSQRTPVPNFTLAGDWTSQKFLGSMEGAGVCGRGSPDCCAGSHLMFCVWCRDVYACVRDANLLTDMTSRSIGWEAGGGGGGGEVRNG